MLKLTGNIPFRGKMQNFFVECPAICNENDCLVVIIGDYIHEKDLLTSTDGYQYWLCFSYQRVNKMWKRTMIRRKNVGFDYIDDFVKRRDRYLTIKEEEQIKTFILEHVLPSVEKGKL